MQREEPVQHTNPPLDSSLHDDDRLSKLRNNGGINVVSLRECSLPPENLPRRQLEKDDARLKSQYKKHSSSRHKDGKKKKGKKKRRDSDRKSEKEKSKSSREKKSKRPDRDAYEAILTDSNSNEEEDIKERKKHPQHRAIPESLTGREISWSRSYLKDTEAIPFRDDLHKAPRESPSRRRSHRRHKSSEEWSDSKVEQVSLNEAKGEETKKEEPLKQITLDADGFPIEDDDSVHSLDVEDFAAEKQSNVPTQQKWDDSFPSTEKSHVGNTLNGSLASTDNSVLDSQHLHLHGSITSKEKSRMDSLLHSSLASTTERSLLSSNLMEVPGAGGLNEFFKQHRRDEMAAIKTAAAFEAFLRKQHEMTSDKDDSDDDEDEASVQSSSHSWSLRESLKGSLSDESDDPFLHSRFWGSESTLLPCTDTVRSFQEETPTGDEFGLVRRNEAFVKRVSSRDLIKSPSEGTLRSSLVDTHSTTRTDSQTLCTLGTKESLSSRLASPSRRSLYDGRRSTHFAPLPSTRSLDAIVPRERTVERQLASLSLSQRACVNALKTKWEKHNDEAHWFPDEMYLRFARCSPGFPFNVQSAWSTMKRFDWRYVKLSMSKLETMVQKKIVFPCPGLKTKAGRNVFYMRPSRYFPKKASSDTMIDLVVYVMNCMLEKEHGSVHGLVLVANMAGWKMENFSVSYWHKLLTTLQGLRMPTRISAFLIVDPPSWFGSIETIMRPMMSDDFLEKVAIASSDELVQYLADGYREHLPDDMDDGKLNTNAIVNAFISERKAIESGSLRGINSLS